MDHEFGQHPPEAEKAPPEILASIQKVKELAGEQAQLLGLMESAEGETLAHLLKKWQALKGQQEDEIQRIENWVAMSTRSEEKAA